MAPEQVIVFIIGTVVVLFGAYYVTYFVGMKASGQTRAGLRNRNIKVVDRYAIARDKQFCVIEVAGKVYILAMTNHSVTLLDTVDAAQFAELTKNDEEAVPWHMTPVGMYGNKLTKKVVAFIAEKTGRVPKTDITAGGSDFAENLKEAERAADDTSENQQQGQPENREDD